MQLAWGDRQALQDGCGTRRIPKHHREFSPTTGSFQDPKEPREDRAEGCQGVGAGGSVQMLLLWVFARSRVKHLSVPAIRSTWLGRAPRHRLLSKCFLSKELFPKNCPSVLPDLQHHLSNGQVLPNHALPARGEPSSTPVTSTHPSSITSNPVPRRLPLSQQLVELFLPRAAAHPE